MTYSIKNDSSRMIVIEPEVPSVCELCGATEETRPYGPNGERICYDCGMKDPAGTEKIMDKILFGDGQ